MSLIDEEENNEYPDVYFNKLSEYKTDDPAWNGTNRTEGLGTAVAFKHTVNDEPCYDETCGICYGDEASE